MAQGWLSAHEVGLENLNDGNLWNAYISLLKSSNTRINENEEVLLWDFSKTGHYTPT